MLTDQVSRLDTKTDEITEYLLPRSTNIRRVFVDETGPRPVLWIGNNHGAAIVQGRAAGLIGGFDHSGIEPAGSTIICLVTGGWGSLAMSGIILLAM